MIIIRLMKKMLKIIKLKDNRINRKNHQRLSLQDYFKKRTYEEIVVIALKRWREE